jgi:hypothetical protein
MAKKDGTHGQAVRAAAHETQDVRADSDARGIGSVVSTAAKTNGVEEQHTNAALPSIEATTVEPTGPAHDLHSSNHGRTVSATAHEAQAQRTDGDARGIGFQVSAEAKTKLGEEQHTDTPVQPDELPTVEVTDPLHTHSDVLDTSSARLAMIPDSLRVLPDQAADHAHEARSHVVSHLEAVTDIVADHMPHHVEAVCEHNPHFGFDFIC